MAIKFLKDLDLLKTETINKINEICSQRILEKYPDWKQRNILASGDQVLIDSTWGYINSFVDKSNGASLQIKASTNANDVYQAYNDFINSI